MSNDQEPKTELVPYNPEQNIVDFCSEQFNYPLLRNIFKHLTHVCNNPAKGNEEKLEFELKVLNEINKIKTPAAAGVQKGRKFGNISSAKRIFVRNLCSPDTNHPPDSQGGGNSPGNT